MKKYLISILAVVMLLSALSICAADFEWTRQGYFTNEKQDAMLYVLPSEDQQQPGWLVGIFSETLMYGDVIPQEGETLHGNIVSEYLDEAPVIVTVSEEGEDGLLLTFEDGSEMHFIPMVMPEIIGTVTINMVGDGQIAYAEGDAEPEFDPDFPTQSIVFNLEQPAAYTLAGKPDEGYKFLKWMKDEEFFSNDPTITVEIDGDTNFLAVFGLKGKDETHVDLDKAKTIGELMGLPNYASRVNDKHCVWVFEQDGKYYRAVADLSPEFVKKFFSVSYDDPDYDEKFKQMVAPLEISYIENLDELVPTKAELNEWIGKTGEELLDGGWTLQGWNAYEMEFFMDYGIAYCQVTMGGDVADPMNFEEDDLKPLVVTAVKYMSMGDTTEIGDKPGD